MLPLLLALVVFASLPGHAPAAAPGPAPPASGRSAVTDSLTHYYAAHDVEAVARLYRQAGTREERLLCLYRLFPLTQDEGLLREIPDEEGVRSARELALISALWAYRASKGPAWKLPTYGRRSEAILRRARALDAAEPYVLLVEGQAFYYKPAVFGGDAREALARFDALRSAVRARPVAGLHPMEAEVWRWMSLRRLGSDEAEPLRQRLLARRPPPLFRQFLVSPP